MLACSSHHEQLLHQDLLHDKYSNTAAALQCELQHGGMQVKADAVDEAEAEAKIEHVQEAYEVLSSHKLRQQYDKIGYSGMGMGNVSHHLSTAATHPRPRASFICPPTCQPSIGY
jgi:curved DNA-binding protein CbpA